MLDINSACLCQSQLSYEECCRPFHDSAKFPATAEALMRSRFTAYAMRNDDYLLSTWDNSKRPKDINFEQEAAEWVNLEIVNLKKGGEKDQKGIVEFKAYYRLEGEDYVMNEISRFKKHAGHWLYLDGVVKSVGKVGVVTNMGKNAPCSCGSGKKFKRCCGK